MKNLELMMVHSVGGSQFGFVPMPQPKMAEPVEICTKIEPPKDKEKDPVPKPEKFTEDQLVSAGDTETRLYFEAIRPFWPRGYGCYWFVVEGAIHESACKEDHMPIYHFGIRKFFQGRWTFDWSKNGTTVYKIQTP